METREDLIARARELIAELEAAKSVDEMTGDELLRAILQKLDAIEEELKRRPMVIPAPYPVPQPNPVWPRTPIWVTDPNSGWRKIYVGDVPNPPFTVTCDTQGTTAITSFTVKQ